MSFVPCAFKKVDFFFFYYDANMYGLVCSNNLMCYSIIVISVFMAKYVAMPYDTWEATKFLVI